MSSPFYVFLGFHLVSDSIISPSCVKLRFFSHELVTKIFLISLKLVACAWRQFLMKSFRLPRFGWWLHNSKFVSWISIGHEKYWAQQLAWLPKIRYAEVEVVWTVVIYFILLLILNYNHLLCFKQIFKKYIEIELQLGNIERCRKLYEKYLEWSPENCYAWSKFAELERSLGETERARALFELAIDQPALDMPELLWKVLLSLHSFIF